MALKLARDAYAGLPEPEKPFAYATLVYPSEMMYNLTALAAELTIARWEMSHGRSDAADAHLADGRRYFDAIMAGRSVYASGKWAGWFTFNRFSFERISEALSALGF